MDVWQASLCQEGHGLCYEITHNGSRWHFQPGPLEWNQAKFMEALDRTDKAEDLTFEEMDRRDEEDDN